VDLAAAGPVEVARRDPSARLDRDEKRLRRRGHAGVGANTPDSAPASGPRRREPLAVEPAAVDDGFPARRGLVGDDFDTGGGDGAEYLGGGHALMIPHRLLWMAGISRRHQRWAVRRGEPANRRRAGRWPTQRLHSIGYFTTSTHALRIDRISLSLIAQI
jgi:hypothetical protein